MKDCHLIVKDNNGRLIALVKMSKNMMFPLNIHYDASKCLSVITNNKEWLWHLRIRHLRIRHLRIRHLNFTSLKMLASKKMVKGMPYIDHLDEFYESCVLSKHYRASFAKEVN
jgi:GTP1/Obg family GTP-binding protein